MYRFPSAFLAPVAALVAALAAAPAAAGGSDIDSDGDGLYSLAELRVFYPTLTADAYRRIDANGDGAVSPSEFRAGQDDGLLPPVEG